MAITPAARRRKALAKPKSSAEVNALAHFSSELATYTPLMPIRGITDPALFRSSWHPQTLAEMFAKARSLLRSNDFVGGVHHVKLCYFADGLRLDSQNKKVAKWLQKARLAGLRMERLDLDVWTEFLTCDSAIVFWRTPLEGSVAVPVVLDCEICQFSDALGVETLKVRPNKAVPPLSETQKAALGKRWADALTRGAVIEIDPSQGENFRVLTWGKLGSGLGWPRLGQILDKLGTRELLEIADWGAAWEHGDVYRQITKGHPIPNGPHAGEGRNFITQKQSTKIQTDNKGKRGPRTLVSNFDVSVAWKYLDPRFFDAGKYVAVMDKLRAWAGAPALIYEAGQAPPNLMSAFATEGRRSRAMVGAFLNSILNDPTFHGTLAPPEELEVSWNAQSFLDTKTMLEWVRAGSSTGLISPQTARNALGVDNAEEAKLLQEALKDPTGYRPVFEAKQGMLSNTGGRPSDKPGAQTPLPLAQE